jgi:hypothetical protein
VEHDDRDAATADPLWADFNLASTDATRARVRRAGRWTWRYHLALAIGTVLFLPLLVVVEDGPAAVLIGASWTAVVILGSGYALRQRVIPRASQRLYRVGTAAWAILWAGALAVGLSSSWSLGTWLLAGVVVALPPAACALLEARR